MQVLLIIFAMSEVDLGALCCVGFVGGTTLHAPVVYLFLYYTHPEPKRRVSIYL